MNILDFQKKKVRGEKLSLITCYDVAFAKLIEQSPIDAVLVGDTTSMVVHGHHSTTQATLEMMCLHTAAVARGLTTTFLIADLPFLTYRKSLDITMDAVMQLMQAGAQAVKLEGAAGNLTTIEHIVQSGVPVMGHLGLMPQAVNALGGFKVQGRQQHQAQALIEQAKALEQAGCFSLVLECIPAELAKTISQQLTIPTIGIGAGPDTDGQILVLYDMLGIQQDIQPKFLKTYLNAGTLIRQALTDYHQEVTQCQYPAREEHCYE